MKMKKHNRSVNGEEMVEEQSLIVCADLILPYLEPVDLASVSLTCKSLNSTSKIVTFRRLSDASNGFEKFPIPFINSIDNQPYAYFTYYPCQTLSASTIYVKQPNIGRPDPFLFRVEGALGCECESCDANFKCLCFESEDILGQECGPSCSCDFECVNRRSQRGVSVKLRIVKDVKKGWGLYAGQPIEKGCFVCEYAGELLATEEAKTRQKKYDDERALKNQISPALLVVKEHILSGNVCIRINIDATRVGNVARFINHCCDGGNLNSVIVRSAGALLPRVCFYASRDIMENEELSFSYGDIRLKEDGVSCFCGSSCCFGILPSENT